MIDVMEVKCPHCNHDFAVDIYVGEESSNFSASLIRKTTQHVSWTEIADEIIHGYGAAVLSVGDKISFQLKNGKQVSVTVAAINPYGDNTVAFSFDDSYWEHRMNSRDTNRGGYGNSEMADYIETEILPQLPDELVNVIVPRMITQVLSGTKYERKCKLWLPSRTEVLGESELYKDCDFGDVQFPLFSTEKSRVKANESGSTVNWSLRSPGVDNSWYFWCVSDYGYGYCTYASDELGVSPCFIIGRQD